MCVKGESRANLFCEIAASVVPGGEFQINAGFLSVPSFVFDPNIGHRGLAADHLQSMPLCDRLFVGRGDLLLYELGKVVVHALLQFVVQNDAKILAATTLDFLGGLLVQPIEIGVVMCFARFGKAVIKDLGCRRRRVLGDKAKGLVL